MASDSTKPFRASGSRAEGSTEHLYFDDVKSAGKYAEDGVKHQNFLEIGIFQRRGDDWELVRTVSNRK
jgi:hypothetical protein